MICSQCGNQIADGAQFCTYCGNPTQPQPQSQPQPVYATPAPSNANQGMDFDFSTNTATASIRYEYKILTQKDKWFSGKFDPALLEQAMNAYAQQGWRVVGCATADINSGFGGRQEFVAILERQR